ncbi:sensor histidine kinase [Teredinibacter turnerae]|uniref:sensor histidine kinase n=1 Tax=Teredinibacter turnerae TaxID=2426 RepID=UPI0003679ACC|nr:histidine kinase [Teredinibacter turnerae]
MAEKRPITEKPLAGGDFLPDLCGVQSVLGLVLVSELLVMALLVSDTGLTEFNWSEFGVVSMLVLWIVLTSAAGLCRLRPLLARMAPLAAGILSYSITLLSTGVFSLSYQHFILQVPLQSDVTFSHLMVAGVIAGITLRYLYLQQQLRNQQKAEMMARIQALQSRIRPHFLFNSMNSIASLIGFDPEAAERMVVDLSQLFRASLKEAGLTPLREEIALCESYIGIEQIRMGARLESEWRYWCDGQPSSLEETRMGLIIIPSFLLQPLVENAIYHGIQPLPEGGRIEVSIALDKQRVEICVRNPVLLNPSAGQAKSTAEGNGMALENIRHRLMAYYEKNAELKVEQPEGEYIIYLRFPARPRMS